MGEGGKCFCMHIRTFVLAPPHLPFVLELVGQCKNKKMQKAKEQIKGGDLKKETEK